MNFLKIWIVVLTSTLVLFNCSKDHTDPPTFDFNAPDAAQNNENNDPGEDVGIGGEDMAQTVALRTIVERPLFGTLPLDNHVLDAMFRVDRSSFWWAMSQGGFTQIPVHRKVFPKTPEGTPALKTVAGSSSFTLGQVNMVRDPMAASIWVGHDMSTDPALVSVTIGAMDMRNPNSFQGVTLAADPDTTTEIDGVRWVKHSGMIDGHIGYGYMLVQSNGSADFLIHAPVVVVANVGNAVRVPGVSRSLRSDEVTAIRTFEAKLERDRALPKPTAIERARRFVR